ncbi:MAG: hypothetical protein QM501_14830, partial [Gimesia sp.]
PGWRHITAVKAKDRLKLYVDGKLVASSSQFDPGDYDLTNIEPLKIGFGAHDYFNGNMKKLKLFRRALKGDEIQKLYKDKK